ncbi:hypothetical protein [Planctomyces sp. SH-PL14]|uniref:hypothetical protein n=1 Tax=Planctomyces sp. SH-PL14 TaxID=1632864 RepID=UPI00078C3365|nr:hypothetical protein [Planctomyces sp. SH-PL14]AMV16620.1 hypothetical protein VT03_01940 [Planctomyces sp. SH-PL14]
MRLTIHRVFVAALLAMLTVAAVPAAELIPADVAAEKAADKQFWLNTDSNVRHNRKCKHFGSTKIGRYCGAGEGKACRLCGG